MFPVSCLRGTSYHISNCKDYDHLCFLKDGDYLTILTAEKELIWEGEIKFVKPNIIDALFPSAPLLQKVWVSTKQKGVNHRTWINWFWEDPPLHAVLKRRVSDTPSELNAEVKPTKA